jgi:membrane protease YdiL (CAAX protease family)
VAGSVPHALSWPGLVNAALSQPRLCPLASDPHAGRSANRGGRWGKAALVAQVCVLGLLWAWVANNTGNILWTAVSHILIDFSAASMGCAFHRHSFAQRSVDCLRRY